MTTHKELMAPSTLPFTPDSWSANTGLPATKLQITSADQDVGNSFSITFDAKAYMKLFGRYPRKEKKRMKKSGTFCKRGRTVVKLVDPCDLK